VSVNRIENPSHSVAEFVRGYEEERRLRGFQCAACGFRTATWGLACPRCGDSRLTEIDLSPAGRVVAFTLVEVPTEEMVNDAPYAYVLVELDGGGRVSGWMPGVRAPNEIVLGTRVRFHPSYRPGVQFEKETPEAA
jgi:uncharacterized OB-fold protein